MTNLLRPTSTLTQWDLEIQDDLITCITSERFEIGVELQAISCSSSSASCSSGQIL